MGRSLFCVLFYSVRNLNIRIDKFGFNAESIGDKLIQQQKCFGPVVYWREWSGKIWMLCSLTVWPRHKVQPNIFLYYIPIPPSLFSLFDHSICALPKKPWRAQRAKRKLFKSIFIIFPSTSAQLDKDIPKTFFLFGVLLLPWNNLYDGGSQEGVGVGCETKREKTKSSFIYDNKQNSKRLEYKWMSVKFFDQPRYSRKAAAHVRARK